MTYTHLKNHQTAQSKHCQETRTELATQREKKKKKKKNWKTEKGGK